jgi:hypothetical protein
MQLIARFTIVLSLVGCSARTSRPDFPELSSVQRVVVVIDGRDTLPAITAPDRVSEIVAFVNDRRDGWGAPWAGVPVPRIRAAFYRDTSARGAMRYFGAGSGFFESSSQPGDFASRAATETEVTEFLRLVGAPAGAAGR